MNSVWKKEGAKYNGGDDNYWNKIGQKWLWVPRNIIFPNHIAKKIRNDNCFENNRFKQYKNKVHPIDFDQFDKGNTKEQDALKGKNTNIVIEPVC